VGDSIWKWDPPNWPNTPVWPQPYGPGTVPHPGTAKPNPLIPDPAPGVVPRDWDLQKAKDYLEILKQIKALEDQIGCPCEPNKADHIQILEDLVAKLKKEKELEAYKPEKRNPNCKCEQCQCGK
jgi:hypothetical protein